jgi:citrate lyase subunit beta/citryl-CoA lyase
MDDARLRLCRTLLFLPASNPRAVEKARSLGADMVVLDCEDSVLPDDKAAAREAAAAALAEPFGEAVTAIRINGSTTGWHAEDLAAVGSTRVEFLILPKAESRAEVERVGSAAGKPVLAMIENPLGVLAAAAIAPAAAGLIVGANDLSASLGIPLSAGRAGLAHALQTVVVAARSAGIAVFDGVCNSLDDAVELEAQCLEGRAYGFDGKSIIHPNQVATVNRLFTPNEDELASARRLIAAARGGAERFEGKMIETLHVTAAEATLAKARLDAL